MPKSGLDFGTACNTQAFLSQGSMFDFYDGGGLDACCKHFFKNVLNQEFWDWHNAMRQEI